MLCVLLRTFVSVHSTHTVCIFTLASRMPLPRARFMLLFWRLATSACSMDLSLTAACVEWNRERDIIYHISQLCEKGQESERGGGGGTLVLLYT